MRELSDLLQHAGPSPGCEHCSGATAAAGEREQVEFKLHATNESHDKMVILVRQSEARLRAKEDEVLQLQNKVNCVSSRYSLTASQM